MSAGERIAFLNLIASDRSSSRLFYVWKLLEQASRDQQMAFVDLVASSIGIVAGLGSFLTFALAPERLLFAVIASVVAIILAVLWRSHRRERVNRGLDSIENFLLQLDELRSYRRELMIARQFGSDDLVQEVTTRVKEGALQPLTFLTANVCNMPKSLFTLVGSTKEAILDEISRMRTEIG